MIIPRDEPIAGRYSQQPSYYCVYNLSFCAITIVKKKGYQDVLTFLQIHLYVENAC